MKPATSTEGPKIDPAALASATVAGILAFFLDPGPFDPLSIVVGVTLLTILFAYEFRRGRSNLQNLAFGTVCGFIGLLVVGPLFELIFALRASGEWPKNDKGDEVSRVTTWHLLFLWIILSGLFWRIGVWGSGRGSD
jgi:hypothetical protein